MNIYKNLILCFERLEINGVQLGDSLEFNLGMDSQEIISLITEIENIFSLRLEIRDLQRKMTVEDVLFFIFEKFFGKDSDYQDQFLESIEINVPLDKAYQALYKYQDWPNLLPNVKKVDELYEDSNIQEFVMHITNLDQKEFSVNTVRKCEQDTIKFFQTSPPEFLSRHSGMWQFKALSSSKTEVSSTHRWFVSEAANKIFTLDGNHQSINEKIHDVLRGHAKSVLLTWKNKLEEQVQYVCL